MPKQLIVISGPTGIGKTQLSLDLANRYGCEIFSADSRQIYKHMNIGTAKPNADELASVIHHFIDEIEPDQTYNVGMFVADFNQRISEAFERNDVAILVGGTGLYIHAVLNGIDDFPDIPVDFRVKLVQKFDEFGLAYLQEAAFALDPIAFEKVDKSNPRRLMRIIEVSTFAGKPYSAFIEKESKESTIIPYDVVNLRLSVDREILYNRINNRVNKMISEGLLEEVKSLLQYRDCQALNTVGYREVFDYIDQKITFEQMVDNIKINSRRYAKRQETWLNKYFDATIFDTADYQKALIDVKNFLGVK